MTAPVPQQVDAFVTPGSLLRAARRARGMDEAEVADRLHWLPGFVAIIEADDYQSLPRPAFARGYVRAYGKLLGVDEAQLLAALDQVGTGGERERPRERSRPLQLQRTGTGVVIGLLVLLLLVLALWWWRGDSGEASVVTNASATAVIPALPATVAGEEE